MTIDDSHLNTLKEMVAVKFNQPPKTPTDFNLLANDIFQLTKRNISISTLKRIWGYVSSNHSTSFSSLSILARYVGYSDWDAFCIDIEKRKTINPTSGFGADSIYISASLPLDSTILLEWDGQKSCKLKKIEEPDIFRIVHSENIKLLPGDIGKIKNFAIGHPLLLFKCTRRGENLGTYSGAGNKGLERISLEQNSNT